MRRSPLFAFLLASAALSRSAAAEPRAEADPPVAVALAAGAATALLPLTIGAMHTANAPVYAYGLRNVGYIVASVGLVLTPIVSHVIVGEYKRAAAFAAAPIAAEIAMIALVSAYPEAVFSGSKGSRTGFGLLFGVTAFSAVAGLVDVALAGDRAKERAKDQAKDQTREKLGGFTVAPMVGGGQLGIIVGGTL